MICKRLTVISLLCYSMIVTPWSLFQKNNDTKIEHPCPKKLVNDMNEDELMAMIPYAKQSGDHEFVYKVFHYLFTHLKDQELIKSYKLGFADYCLDIQEYEKAALAYEEFFVTYPGSKEWEYAQYKGIVCWFMLSLDGFHDQHNTHKTIYLIDLYLAKAIDATLIAGARDVRKQCRQRLFQHELHIWTNYLQRKKFSSVEQRYKYIEEHFGDIEHLDKYLAYCAKMKAKVSDPKTCPFWIRVNFEDALHDENNQSDKKSLRAATYFL